MLRIPFVTIHLIISSICFPLVVGCEAPQQTSPTLLPKPNPTKNTDTQIVKTAVNLDDAEILRKRVVDTYMRYWPLISSEHQHEQLPDVLGDPMEELRVFGIERVGVFIRDGEATEEELQLVINQLADENSSVRLAAAILLPEIRVPGLAEHVALSLANEECEEVVEQELIFFQTVPHPSAIQPTIQRLIQNPMGAAPNTLVYLLNTNNVSEKTKNQILQIVMRSRQQRNVPSLLTLEAMLGNNETKRRLSRLLDYHDESVRIAVARGFAFVGFSTPLISRANDELLYTYALIALQNNANIESFKELLEIRKDGDSNWNTAIITVATSLTTSDLLRANDMLARLKLDELRLSILSEAWKNTTNKNHTVRKTIAELLIPLMIKLDDAVGALQLSDAFEDSINDEDIITLRFIAAINASAWDTAEDARPEPAVWIDEWERVKKTDLNAASVIKKQIIQRFVEQLTPAQLKLLDIEPPDETEEETS